MSDARGGLLDQVITGVARDGLADRSLREIAASAGTSHRMLLYHFEDRAGLVAAIVARTEEEQRRALVDLASEARTAEDLIRGLWLRVSSPEMRPFVRLFFELVAVGDVVDLTDSWLESVEAASRAVGEGFDRDRARLGVAVTRGLLIDVLTTGSTDAADRALDQFIAMWGETG